MDTEWPPDHELLLTLEAWHAEASARWRAAMHAATLITEPLARRLLLGVAAAAAAECAAVARVLDAAAALAKPSDAARWTAPEGGRFR
jgi:hypothetical protein